MLFVFSSGERSFKRLENKYEKSSIKCEKLAKKMASRNSKTPVPYYFLALINYDRYGDAKSAKIKYRHFTRALSYANKLERLNTDDMYNSEKWYALRRNIEKEIPKIVMVLKKEELNVQVNNITRKSAKLGILVSSKLETKVRKNDPEILTSSFNQGQYFGMPNGSENVLSANVSLEKEVIAILNTVRKQRGMPALIWDEDLARAARYQSFDMATQHYFSHASYDRIDGRLIRIGNTFDRIKKFYTKGFVNSENLAAGNATAKGTYTQWYNSKGHNRNMFNKNSTKVGVGLYYDKNSPYKYYWSFCTALN